MRLRKGLLALLLWTCATPPPPPPPPPPDFKEELRRHGEWILVSPYGKLWHPNVQEAGKDFVPYLTGGHWVPTPKGWTFKGRWRWSDAVFHHGRWLWTNDYDWVWSADDVEGLAFVKWRAGSEFVGWAPIAPVARGSPPQEERWVYVKARAFAQPDVEKYRLGGDDVGKALSLTEPLPPSPFEGPKLDFVAQNGGVVMVPDGGVHVPDLTPPPPPEPAVEQAPPPTEVEVVKPQAPAKSTPKKKAPKKSKKH